MISVESQVLNRHLSLFAGKTILFAGSVNDNFPMQIAEQCKAVKVWSWYFDYANSLRNTEKSAVDFSPFFQGSADLIVYYWTKNKAEVQFQLMQLLAQSQAGQEILIVGENRCGVRSAEKMLEPYGEIGKIDSARRCGLYHFQLQNPPHFELETYWKTYQTQNLGKLIIHSLPGVFSAAELDNGTALLLSTINTHIRGDVLDLGCGAGVIGAYLKQQNPKAKITLTDIHAMAIESAKQTLAQNQLEGSVFASDVFSHITEKFDLIISNPPFHDGIDTAYRAVGELIKQAKWHLKAGGELRIVANAFLPYPDLLDQYFGSCEVLAQNSKFKVYSVRA